MTKHPESLHELLQIVRNNASNIYFKQIVPRVYGSDGMSLDYINAMNDYFRAFDTYKALCYNSCDRQEREELVTLLAKQAMAIQCDSSIPSFGTDKQCKYDFEHFAMALSAGNFTDEAFGFIRQKASDIMNYAASHLPVDGKLSVTISRISYYRSLWDLGGTIVLSFRDNGNELGCWSCRVGSSDVDDTVISDVITDLVEEYMDIRFCVADGIILDDVTADIVPSMKFALDVSQRQRDARQRVLSGKSYRSIDIAAFLHHRDTEYSLLEFKDADGIISACYAAVYEVNNELHFVPVLATGPVVVNNPVYDILQKGLKRPFLLQNGFIKQMDVSDVSIKINSHGVSQVDELLSGKLRVYSYPAKTISMKERHDELMIDILVDYKQRVAFKPHDNNEVPKSSFYVCKSSGGNGLMDIDTSGIDNL